MPFFDKYGELHHLKDTGTELILNTLRGQYHNERQLLALLCFLETLENMELI